MQILGSLASEGFTHKDLLDVSSNFEKKGCECELIHLNKLLDDPNGDTSILSHHSRWARQIG